MIHQPYNKTYPIYFSHEDQNLTFCEEGRLNKDDIVESAEKIFRTFRCLEKDFNITL